MKPFFEWITAHPKRVIVLCLVLTAGFGFGLTKITTEADVENMLPEGQPSVVHTREVHDIFEFDESVVLGIVHAGKGGIYRPDVLQKIHRITEQLEDLPGIDPSKIWSIFTVSDIVAETGGFAVVPLCERVPKTQEEIETLKRRINANPLYRDKLVSTDNAGALINMEMTPVADKAAVYYALMDLLQEHKNEELEFYVTGGPVIAGIIGKHVERDMSKMMPLVCVVIVLMLLIIFKTLRGVALPLLVVLFSVIWSMGLMAYLGIPIYPMTTIMPIVIMAIGVADGIHILARYTEGARDHPEQSARALTLSAMQEMWSPVVMTSLTTTIGFLSLLSSDMKPVFYTGIFTSVGVMAAMLFSLTLIPAALTLLPVPRHKKTGRWWIRADAIFERAGFAVYRLRIPLIVGCVLTVIASLIGLLAISVDSDPLAYFNQNDPIPVSHTLINNKFAGATVVHTTLSSNTEKRFLDPETLEAMDTFQREIETIPEIGSTTSLADLVKLMNRAMHEDDPDKYTVPDSRNLIATYLMLYSGDNLNHYINYGRDKTNVQSLVRTSSTKELERVLTRVRRAADRCLNPLPDVDVVTGGIGAVLVDQINIIVYGQIYSIFLSMIGVFLITSIMFRSPVAGLFNALPIAVAICMNFGLMGIFRIPLEPSTAITSCIGIGVGIDYAIHFIAKYRRTRRSGLKGRGLIARTMATAGKAIFFNAAVVIGGFMVLTASEFPPSRHIGVMISLNMFNSFLASVTILPVLLTLFDPGFCRKPPKRLSEETHA